MWFVDIRAVRPEDWTQIWPFFRDIVAAGETYAYPDDISRGPGAGVVDTG